MLAHVDQVGLVVDAAEPDGLVGSSSPITNRPGGTNTSTRRGAATRITRPGSPAALATVASEATARNARIA
ncbi:MAG: hypothetical protein E6J91_29410 [Deltaproteobacteria bacterium]|nr:MAG: hypothetical protein E6J91_29410 [Deltaproteobacteria bacterium]